MSQGLRDARADDLSRNDLHPFLKSDRLEWMPGWLDLTRAPERRAQAFDALFELRRCGSRDEIGWLRRPVGAIGGIGELPAGICGPPLLDQVAGRFDHVAQGFAPAVGGVAVARTGERPGRHRCVEENEDVGDLLLPGASLLVTSVAVPAARAPRSAVCVAGSSWATVMSNENEFAIAT